MCVDQIYDDHMSVEQMHVVLLYADHMSVSSTNIFLPKVIEPN
jgi:hypothetical protein